MGKGEYTSMMSVRVSQEQRKYFRLKYLIRLLENVGVIDNFILSIRLMFDPTETKYAYLKTLCWAGVTLHAMPTIR